MIINKIQDYYNFCSKETFWQLIGNHIFLKTFNSEYDEIKVWLTDQNSEPLEMEDRINLTMVIK